jgi:hypothetical protein
MLGFLGLRYEAIVVLNEYVVEAIVQAQRVVVHILTSDSILPMLLVEELLLKGGAEVAIMCSCGDIVRQVLLIMRAVIALGL